MGDKELFDDIDTEKDDINDSNLIVNNKKENNNTIEMYGIKKENDISGINEDTNKENKKKYFEADDALKYSKNKEKEKEKIKQEMHENESNTINAKSSYNLNKRKFNKNYFNKSKPYPINNKNDLLTSKFNRNSFFINRYQSGSKNSQNNNKNNFLYPTKKIVPKDFLNYSTRKKKENPQNNNFSSSNYKLFKDKAKTNLYLKYKTNNSENVELIMNKNNPITKHNSNVFYFHNNNKTNRNKNIRENPKFSLFKNDIKQNNEICVLKSAFINKQKKKIIPMSGGENNSLLNGSNHKMKRPTSCSNKKTEKIFYEDKNNNKRIMKFANQGKKIYLKTNKTSINTDNINNANINSNDKLNSSDSGIEKNKAEKIINLTSKNNNRDNPHLLSPSGNIITDIFFVRNLGENSFKTVKAPKIKYNTFYEVKEGEQKRFPSAINAKLMIKNNKNILIK